MYNLADSGFFKNFLYQGGVRPTVIWVFEGLKFKISEAKLRQLTGQSQENTNFGPNLLKGEGVSVLCEGIWYGNLQFCT